MEGRERGVVRLALRRPAQTGDAQHVGIAVGAFHPRRRARRCRTVGEDTVLDPLDDGRESGADPLEHARRDQVPDPAEPALRGREPVLRSDRGVRLPEQTPGRLPVHRELQLGAGVVRALFAEVAVGLVAPGLVVDDMDDPVVGDVDPVDPSVEGHRAPVGKWDRHLPDWRAGEPEVQFGGPGTCAVGGPVLAVVFEHVDQVGDDPGFVAAPEDGSAGQPVLFGLGAEPLGDRDQSFPVGRGPGVRRTGLLGRRSGEHFSNELLEDFVDERATVARGDGELFLGVLHLFDAEDVADQVGEGAGRPRFEAGCRHDAFGGRRDCDTGQVAVEAGETAAPARRDHCRTRGEERIGRGGQVRLRTAGTGGEKGSQAVLLVRGRKLDGPKSRVERGHVPEPRFVPVRIEEVLRPPERTGKFARSAEHPPRGNPFPSPTQVTPRNAEHLMCRPGEPRKELAVPFVDECRTKWELAARGHALVVREE